MPVATVTSKGQVTIPAEVRKALGLSTGSRVAFVHTRSGTYELVPETRTISALKGAIARPARPVSLEKMDLAIAEAAAENTER